MPVVPLPERANLEQLKKQAKWLLRAIRDEHPTAAALVAEHHRNAPAAADFTLDAAQFVLARSYGFASWAKLRERVPDQRPQSRRPGPSSGIRVLTVENEHHAQPGWAADDDVERLAARWPEVAGWSPLLSVHHNGVRAIAFGTPGGFRFAELTPTTIALSEPTTATLGERGAVLLFHTALGTMGGLVTDKATSLQLERPTDLVARKAAVLHDGFFLVPNAFPVTPSGLILRCDYTRTAEIVPTAELPAGSESVVDRPRPPAERDSVAAQRLADAIAASDVPPPVDPDQWSAGVHMTLTDAEDIRLGRYGNLLGWITSQATYDQVHVFDFGPRQGDITDFMVVGGTVSATRVHYDFQDGTSGTTAVVGLVDDDRVASVVLRRDGLPDESAVIDHGTFVIPKIVNTVDIGGPGPRLVSMDAAGHELEVLAYRQAR